MTENNWSLWYTPYVGVYDLARLGAYPSLEAVDAALEELADSGGADSRERYEIRELIDGEWVTHFVAEWTLYLMVPKEADDD